MGYVITAGAIGLALCLMAIWPSIHPRITPAEAEEEDR